MARKLRVDFPGAIYHVMNRGGRREHVFRDDRDQGRFVETLAEACAKTACLGLVRPQSKKSPKANLNSKTLKAYS